MRDITDMGEENFKSIIKRIVALVRRIVWIGLVRFIGI